MPHSILSMFPFIRFLMSPDGEGQGGVAGSGEDYPPAKDVDESDVDEDEDDDSDDSEGKKGEDANGAVDEDGKGKEGEKPNPEGKTSEDGKKPEEGKNPAPKKEDGNPNPETKPTKPKQSAEDNHKFAEMRRKAEEDEAKAAEIQKARDEGEIQGLGGKNPFTGKAISDAVDLEQYRDMKAIKDNGGDPIADYADFVANKRRAEVKKAEEQSKTQKERDKHAKEQIDQFIIDNPAVDLGALLDNPDFKEFANKDNLIENVPFQRVYEMFQSDQQAKKAAAEQKSDRKEARKGSSDGSLLGSGDQQFYSLEELKKLTPDQIKANQKKVDASYERVLHHQK